MQVNVVNWLSFGEASLSVSLRSRFNGAVWQVLQVQLREKSQTILKTVEETTKESFLEKIQAKFGDEVMKAFESKYFILD